ncbi:MAG TPA: DUF3592 domain-containing protein [Bryobacteraceae bacterium]|nr:DUF3592 domain-containing protein [Bryobacteraceae bacterium]
MRLLLLFIAAAFALPALYLLAVVYSAPAVQATVDSRKMHIRGTSGKRGGTVLAYDVSLRFVTAGGEPLYWTQQLPGGGAEEALMFFDDYPPQRPVTVYRTGTTAMLRRGLPDWRFGVGWGLLPFGLAFLFFYYISGATMEGSWLRRPPRAFALMGLLPLVGGTLLFLHLRAKASWPRVQVRVERLGLLPLMEARGADLTIDDRARQYLDSLVADTIVYQYEGRDYLYPAGADVEAYDDGTHPTFVKVVNPEKPSDLSNIPVEGDDKSTGVYVLLGFGVVFVLLGLLIP